MGIRLSLHAGQASGAEPDGKRLCVAALSKLRFGKQFDGEE
ncbi:hypothetical protein Z948_1159 [Sulfitobacter donghicola DSW-25 = KCTC 12864 = JCM 14565]|nr:hypothetical protein Z948_1159 [Sulfitobacter donghicola DSW-25 = KCTC 12864 = JCM 14565]